MSEPQRQKNKIKSTLCEHLIPETGVFGDMYLAKDTGGIWYCNKAGLFVSLSDILHGEHAHTPPRHGKDGVDGAPGAPGVSIKGDKGDAGRDGKDGVGYPGATGPAGQPGKNLTAEVSQLESHIVQSERTCSGLRGELVALKQQVETLSVTVNALLSASIRDGAYVAYLQEKVRSKS
jgi:hypothetical protein